MFKSVTINDIAKLVGVSKATISYYLSGNYKKMSLETKRKIKEAIELTGYQPNKIAQSLVTRDSQTIGVVIADITNPFISSVMKGISDTCKKYGYAVHFTNSDNDPHIELENLHRLKQQKVSGIILNSVNPNNPAIKNEDPNTLVMVDRQAHQLQFDTVVSDNRQSVKRFLNYMIQAGYEHLYFVSYPIKGISTRELRYQGFVEMVGPKKDNLIILENNTLQVKERIFEIIEHSPSKPAFLTMNAPTLLSFMKILHQSTFTYPKDFGLGTYENLDWMQVLNPQVSCISQDSYRIGCVAVEHLLDKLQSKQQQQAKIIEVLNTIVLKNSF